MSAMHLRCLLVFCLCILSVPSAFAVAAGQSRSIEVNKIAAVINGEIVTLHELRRNAAPELARLGIDPSLPGSAHKVDEAVEKILQLMIDDILLRQEAARLKITVNDSEVENELRKIIQRSQVTPQEFEARITAQGSTMAMLKERLRNNILSQRIVSIMIARKVVVTKEEIARYYAEHKKEFTAEKTVDMALIVFSPTADADAVYARIKNRTMTFEAAASQYSVGPEAARGGKIGHVPWNDLAAPIKAELLQLHDGQMSDVFMLDLNKAIVRLDGSTVGSQMTLEQASPDIERILREPRLEERFKEYTRQLRGRAVIDVRL